MNENKRRVKSGFVLGIVMLLVVCSLGVIASPARAAIVPEWTAAPDIGDTYTQAVVVNDDDGLVYVMGGVKSISMGNYDQAVPDAASYDPDTGDWTVLEPMPTGVRGAAGVFGQDGRVYVIGGYNNSAGVIDSTQIYDPDTDTWSSGAAIPVGAWEAKAVAVYEDTLVVAGGEGAAGQVYRYDISDDSWVAGASMPVAMLGGSFVCDGYYSYYLGGSDSSYVEQSYAFVYYPWDSWSWMDDMPAAVVAHASVLGADGYIYVFGGGNSVMNVEPGRTAGYCVNPDTWTWSTLPDLTVAAKYLGAAATPDGRIFAVGGNDDTTMLSTVESMRVMSVSTTVSDTAVGPGEDLLVTVSMDFAYGVPEAYYVNPYLLDSNDVVYNPMEVYSPMPNSFAFEISIPASAAPGPYELVLHDLVAYYYDGGNSVPDDFSIALTVLDVNNFEEQLAALQADIDALTAALAAEGADVDALTIQVAVMQAKLDGIIAGMTAMGASQAATMEDLNATLDGLQAQLDAFQEQIDRIENKADTAGTYGIVTMVLVIIIIVLVALMLVMARKKP
jgi:N-acetylneuraminic acid mutarotase/uncharacterized small protein (DUF1192 family)